MKNSLRKFSRGTGLPAAVLGVSVLVLSGCGAPPAETPSGGGASASATSGTDYLGCIVSDSGGFDDRSFNQSSYEGLKKAETDLGIKINQAESRAETDFGPNVDQMVQSGCNLTVTVGFLLADTTKAAAEANTEANFAIVDDNSIDLPNVKPIIYDTAQAAFLAGYAAAATSETGKVATYGGINIPTVTIFMDGFAQGVKYYNSQKKADVQVLGWNTDKQDGQFVGGFEDQKSGQRTAENLISQGADIVLPVAGPAGIGALQAAKSSGGKVNAIWVDTDGCVSAQAYCGNIVSSVYKGMDVAVADAIKASRSGSFSSEPYVGDLKNSGTGLSPFHDFDGKVPAALKTELDTIKADITSGKITIESKSQPTS